MLKISKLKNGINLLRVPVKGAQSVTVLALFPVGSRYETKEFSGASHFVEHMIFKGTEKRPFATDISKLLDALGADYNAFTGKDYTGYYIKIASDKQEIAYDILSDIMYHSTFNADEIEKEKGAIVEELRMYLDNPVMAIDILFDTALFGDTPLGWDIGGTPETVRALTRKQLYDYYKSHYSPKNTALAVVGDIKPKAIKNLIKHFDIKWDQKNSYDVNYHKKNFQPFFWPKKTLPISSRVIVQQKKSDQVNLILGFPGLPNEHPDRYVAAVLINILGSGMSSRLFVEVREKRGLAYSIRSGSIYYRDVGAYYVQAGLDPARLLEAMQVIKAEIKRIAEEPVTEEELENAKSNIAGRFALGFEDSYNQANWYAKQFLFDKKVETPEQSIKHINKVTIEDVKRLAAQIFVMDELRAAVIGPLPKVKVIDILKKA